MSNELTPQEVLRKAQERMTPDNWASDGWGDGKTACLMYQLAIAAEAKGSLWTSLGQGPIGKAISYLRRAIKKVDPDWYEEHGKYADRRDVIANFNDDARTTYEDASMVLKEALFLAEQEGL